MHLKLFMFYQAMNVSFHDHKEDIIILSSNEWNMCAQGL